jgi:hypothetical protein
LPCKVSLHRTRLRLVSNPGPADYDENRSNFPQQNQWVKGAKPYRVIKRVMGWGGEKAQKPFVENRASKFDFINVQFFVM